MPEREREPWLPDLKSRYDAYNGHMAIVRSCTPEFMTGLIDDIDTATERVWVQTMLFESGGPVDPLIEAMGRAASRGVDTRLMFDFISVLANDKQQLRIMPRFVPSMRTSYQKFIEREKERMDYLTGTGVKTHVTNLPRSPLELFFLLHREHGKSIITDQKARLGGINLTPEHLRFEDFMVELLDPELVEMIATYFSGRWNRRFKHDITVTSSDKKNSLVIDHGRRKQSAVMDRFKLEASKTTRSMLTLSQFMPHGVYNVAAHGAAERNVFVEMITHGYDKQWNSILKAGHIVSKLEQWLSPCGMILHYPDYVHSKLAIFDEHTVGYGSFNFSCDYSVQGGIGEIVMFSNDHRLAENAMDYYEEVRTVALLNKYEKTNPLLLARP